MQKYLTVTNHVYSPWIVLVSKKWWRFCDVGLRLANPTYETVFINAGQDCEGLAFV